jgi:cytochrome c
MKIPAMLTLGLLVMLPQMSVAQGTGAAGAALAKTSRCYACHTLTEPLIGPPYQAIAIRYSGDRTTMENILAKKILLGGGGNWGDVPMVPNEHVKPADALTLARWILDQSPGKKTRN